MRITRSDRPTVLLLASGRDGTPAGAVRRDDLHAVAAAHDAWRARLAPVSSPPE